jgi:hypothetical protein
MSIRGNQVSEDIKEKGSYTGRDPEFTRPPGFAKPRGGSNLEPFKRVVRQEQRVNPFLVVENPLFVYDPGLGQSNLCVQPMDPASNGGDQGGANEAPTRPKLLAGDSSVPTRGQGSKTAFGFGQPDYSNWHSAVREGLADVEELLEGEVDMEDEDVIELEPEEDEEPAPEAARRWRLVGRYVSVRKPNIDDMTDHFNGVRMGVNFAPMGKNWFHVTLFSKGDYEFVARGGPWIYRGYPLLVAKIPEVKWPSETVLNSVPLWVQVYDLPWNRQKKSTALLVGAKLGKYLEADLGADGYSPYDFLRVRVDIPVDKRLRATVTTQVKGHAEVSTYLLRYERVPYFCFWCGFVGHDDTVCEKKRIGMPSLEYDTRLRCSPVKKFQRRQAYAPPKQHFQTRKGLNFSSSTENSGNLGVPTDIRWNRNVVRHTGNHIPSSIDARDGFDESEAEGSSEVDVELAKRITSLNFPQARTDVQEGNGGRHKAPKKTASRGGRNRGQMKTPQGPGIVENLIPLAMFPAYPSSSYLAGLGREEMIPPLRGLDSFVFSAGDTLMSDADSILGKRSAQHEEGESEDMSKAMVVRDDTSPAGKLKKGKTEAEKVREVEATSLGAAGQLT